MNVAELLLAQATRRPEAPAITWMRRGVPRTISFGALERRSAGAARRFDAAGLTAGERVVVMVPVSLLLYITVIGLMRRGLVPTFIDPRGGAAHLDLACALAQPAGLVVSPAGHALRVRHRGLRRVPRTFTVVGTAGWTGSTSCLAGTARCAPTGLGRTSWSAGTARRAPTEVGRTFWSAGTARCAPTGGAIVPRCADDPAMLVFTSGSTGAPRAALRTHGFVLAQHRAVARAIDLREGQRDLSTMPNLVLANLASGVESVIADGKLSRPGSIDPDRLLRQIAVTRPTRCVASPALLEHLADRAIARRLRLESFEHLHTGGAPVFRTLLRKLQRVAPRAAVSAVYGSTEAEPIACLGAEEITSADARAMAGGAGILAGRPVPEISLRVIDAPCGQPVGPLSAAELERRTCPTGSAGEIIVSGAHVLDGYLGGIGDEQTKIRADGAIWHRTGDTGRLDSAGRLWLLGRAAARINDARGELHPFAVESAAREATRVRRSALISRAGRRVLLVEPRCAVSSRWVSSLTRELAWAQLDEVVVVRSIPVDRRHNARVDYVALAQRS